MSQHYNLIIFGGQGDLALRKLLPSIFRMFVDNRIPQNCNIIGVSRQNTSTQEYQNIIEKILQEDKNNEPENLTKINSFINKISYCQIDFSDRKSFDNLSKFLDTDAINIHYLAVHFSFYIPITKAISELGFIENSRLVLEKPIGYNLETAKEINTAMDNFLKEEQIFRIDHYLGKESVQNLFALRFGNTIFETLWNRNHISHIEISIAESLGIEDRGGFYDKTGALRDMIQSHLLQLLSIIAMDPPSQMSANKVRDEKIKVLLALREMTPEVCIRDTIRGQYLGNDEQSSYLLENGIAQNSQTETFVSLKCWVDNWRWSGVPFYLRTGKRMKERLGQIIVHFNQVPHCLFPIASKKLKANALVIGLNPMDTLSFKIMAKVPGDNQTLHPVQLNLEFSEHFGIRTRDGYERLLSDLFKGDLTLFLRRDEIESAWTWIDNIIETWQKTPQHIQNYQSGTWGPQNSLDFISQSGFIWNKSLKPQDQ